MTLGAAIKRLRAAAGWSQKDFAEQLEISPSYLSLVEADKREPTIPLVRRMAEKLGVPAVILFAAALEPRTDLDGEAAKLLSDVLEKLVEVAGASVTQMSLGLSGKT
jgi:transcriptional regulator with XRE-family HTH domain